MRPTDAEVAALLRRASWQVEGSGFQLPAAKRHAMAEEMRVLADVIAPQKPVDLMASAAEYYRPGVYNGD